MADELGVAFLTTGFDPKWAVKDVPIMPKNRYRSTAYSLPGHCLVFSACPAQLAVNQHAYSEWSVPTHITSCYVMISAEARKVFAASATTFCNSCRSIESFVMKLDC